MSSLLVLFGPDSSIGVSNSDGQLLGAFNESLAILGGDTMGNLSAELLVLHHKNFQFLQEIKKMVRGFKIILGTQLPGQGNIYTGGRGWYRMYNCQPTMGLVVY